MGQVKISRLFKKTLAIMIVLFGLIAAATSVLSGWNLYTHLSAEYESKGKAIAKSVADSAVEILLNRDASTVQAVVDQFLEIQGVSYVIVFDGEGEAISYTFVPSIPDEVLAAHRALGAQSLKSDTTTVRLAIPGRGNFLDIAAPILAGVAGYVHVGMDQSLIRSYILSAVLKQQGLMLAIFLLSAAVAYALVNRISRPLNVLADHAQRLAATEDFGGPVNIPREVASLAEQSRDEIGNLAQSFVYMETTLARHVQELKETTAAKERIESELKIAHDIQMSMVPKIFPAFPSRSEFDLYAVLVPAKEVGGDFYDFFFIDEDRLCFAIGDVSGKGVPASLFMAVTKTLFKATGAQVSAPDAILTRLNREICRDNDSCMFVTLFCAVLNLRSGEVVYSNGGHNLPYVLRSGFAAQLENTEGIALGVMEDASYHARTIVLRPGDGLLLYTDGVTEAMDPEDRLFSDDRLQQVLEARNGGSPQETIRGVVDEVRKFAAGAPQADDITVLGIDYFGKQGLHERADLHSA
jgi:sigma-B regulation protein RsbU (phosphoserine phosphatase)